MPPPKVKELSLQQKIEVIHIYNKFHSARKAAQIYKCSRTYVTNIIRKKKENLADWKNTRYVDLILKEWVYRAKLVGNTVSNDQIVTTGEIIIRKLRLPVVSTMCWLRQTIDKFRLYNHFKRFTGKIMEQKSLDIDDIIQDLRGILNDMGYRKKITVKKQHLKPKKTKEVLDSDKLAEVDPNQIYSITNDNCEVGDTMNNLKIIKTETIDDVEIVARAIHANQIYSITDDSCEVDETMNNLKLIKTETIDDVEIVDGPIHPNDITISELELNQSFFDKIHNEKGTNVPGRIYLDAYNHLGCLEVNLLHKADLHGLKLINDLKKHLLIKIVDIRKHK